MNRQSLEAARRKLDRLEALGLGLYSPDGDFEPEILSARRVAACADLARWIASGYSTLPEDSAADGQCSRCHEMTALGREMLTNGAHELKDADGNGLHDLDPQDCTASTLISVWSRVFECYLSPDHPFNATHAKIHFGIFNSAEQERQLVADHELHRHERERKLARCASLPEPWREFTVRLATVAKNTTGRTGPDPELPDPRFL